MEIKAHGPHAKLYDNGEHYIIINAIGEEIAYFEHNVKGALAGRMEVNAYRMENFVVVRLGLERWIHAMNRGNKFIGDAPDNMDVCRYEVNRMLREFGYADMQIKRNEKFNRRQALANRIYGIMEAL